MFFKKKMKDPSDCLHEDVTPMGSLMGDRDELELEYRCEECGDWIKQSRLKALRGEN